MVRAEGGERRRICSTRRNRVRTFVLPATLIDLVSRGTFDRTKPQLSEARLRDALGRRPQLAAVLSKAGRMRCPVAVARPDRLSRDVHFISGLIARRLPFLVAERAPEVDPFVLKPLCGAPEKERGLIADSAKSALAAAKAKGVKLGNPQIEAAQGAAVAAVRAEADRAARNVLPIICEIQKSGSKTLRAIAEALNARGIPTPRGGRWHAMSVRNVAHGLQQHEHRHIGQWSAELLTGKNEFRDSRLGEFADGGEGRLGQRHAMLAPRLHARRRDCPEPRIEIEFPLFGI
jgi:DNA invertase Pin-like site-specific DNA recombinase